MRALLKPRQGRPTDATEVVTMIARTGRGRVTVQLGGRTTFAVDSFRLYSDTDRTRRVSGTELAALPWAGKGPDPLGSSPGAGHSVPLIGALDRDHDAPRSGALPARNA